MKNQSILIVDDNRDVLDALGVLLEDDFKKVEKLHVPTRLPSILAERFDVILLDMNFSAGVNTGNEGLYWLSKIKELSPSSAIVMMTAYGSIDLAVEAIKRGASDFVVKPWDNSKLLATVNAIASSIARLKGKRGVTKVSNHFIEGRSDVMVRLQEQLSRVASTDASVLLLGENGTGKEVFARQIHLLSNRASSSFALVDLSTIPESLFESELFGHKRGAFTDAKEDRQGKFLAANGGTLFLDEIGNLALAQQVKILTVLQTRSVTPVGSTEPSALDVRLITATNASLSELVSAGKFRQDLLYRINTITLTIPPLRERGDDIELLAAHFLEEYKALYNRDQLTFSPQALAVMRQYHWPGNIRELRHTIEKAVILSNSNVLESKDLELSISGKSPSIATKTLDVLEKEAMQDALAKHKGNIVHAAKALGITRQTFYNKMKRYGL